MIFINLDGQKLVTLKAKYNILIFIKLLSHLVPDFVTPCTKPCHTFYQTSVSVYSDRDSDRDRDKKNIDKIYNYRVRDTDAMKP